MASVDIINVIITADRKDDFENIYKSASLSRVKEMGMKMAANRHKQRGINSKVDITLH
uniref:Uncharacterized protein n=1 Tax=Arion vulgaris TaxID=1028688 RepID=A0A0B7A320_9EUPU